MGKSFYGSILLCLLGCSATQTAGARPQAITPDHEPGGGSPLLVAAAEPVGWLGAGLERQQVLVGPTAQTHLGVWLQVPETARPSGERPPMSVALVIDASGSMRGEKIQRARESATRFIEHLHVGDEASLYAFDDQVMELMAPVRIDERSRAALLQAVGRVRDDGNTNMYGAVMKGQAAVARAPASHPIRRVVLLSDGKANVGPSAAADFLSLAQQGAGEGTQVSAIGIGLGYDETTLGALAMGSEGRMYHLEHAGQLASILEQELDLLSETVATGAYVELEPAEGVRILGVDNGRAQRHGDVWRIPVGSLYAGQERELLVRTSLDAGTPGQRPFGRVRLSYVDASGQQRSEALNLDYGVTRDPMRAQQSGHERVVAMVETKASADAQLAAATMLNEGDSEAASQVLQVAAQRLEEAASKSSGKTRRKLKKRARKVQEVQERAARSKDKTEARGAALMVYDDAMEASGY